MVNQKSNTGQAKDGRCRNWDVVLYPESAPENWRDILDDLRIEWAESPLHDQDINPTGEKKKPHWHLLLCFPNVKSFEQVKSICDSINAPIPQRCQSMRGTVRYMAHLDHPDKAQYSASKIIGHGGFDVAAQLRATSSERYQIISDMMEFCKQNNICEMSDLSDYARTEHYDDWFPILTDSATRIMETYVRSIRHKKDPSRSDFRKGMDAKSARQSAGLQPLPDGCLGDVDPDTGELIGVFLPPIGR